MKYLYTTQPDDKCHEVEPGIYGRPAHTTEQARLRLAGWVYNISDLKGDDYVREEKEGREEEVEVTDSQWKQDIEDLERHDLEVRYKEKFGKPPHHKMKAETIRKKLDESDD